MTDTSHIRFNAGDTDGEQLAKLNDLSEQVTTLMDAGASGSGGSSWKEPVRAKTAAALPANTYGFGSTSGPGSILTGTSNGALAAVDGVTLVANDRVLVDQEVVGAHNGIYVVTQVGDASNPYILTRAEDADETDELVNAAVKISEGSTFADQEWQCTTNATIVVGSTALVWAQATGGGAGTVTTTGSPASGNLAKFSGASSITNGDLSGDVTTSGTLATTIGAGKVTLAKIANAAANSKLVGSGASGSGTSYSEISLGGGLNMSGTTLSATGATGAAQWILIDSSGLPITTATVTITIASPGVVTWNSHGFAADTGIVLTTTGALPTGLTPGTTYYVRNPTTNTFELSATVGGSSINTTGSQSGTHSSRKAATWTWSTNVAQVDTIGLGGYNELFVFARGVTASISGRRQLFASVDNGSTFYTTSGDYVSSGVDGTETNTATFGVHDTNSASARNLVIYITNLGGPCASSLNWTASDASSGRQRILVASISRVNAIRFSNNTGGNLTAGALYVFAR